MGSIDRQDSAHRATLAMLLKKKPSIFAWL